jgi:hypothetical protein
MHVCVWMNACLYVHTHILTSAPSINRWSIVANSGKIGRICQIVIHTNITSARLTARSQYHGIHTHIQAYRSPSPHAPHTVQLQLRAGDYILVQVVDDAQSGNTFWKIPRQNLRAQNEGTMFVLQTYCTYHCLSINDDDCVLHGAYT